MATPPPYVAEYESSWTTTTNPKTSSVTVAAGDILVVLGVTSDDTVLLNTPTGGGLTYELQQETTVDPYCRLYIWTAKATSAQTFTLSITKSGATGSINWGHNVIRFGANGGVGASAKINALSGAPSLALTTTRDNSAVVVVAGDWDALSGAIRTWRTGAGALTERTYDEASAYYTIYAGVHADAGAAGLKTVGLSAPTNLQYTIAAVEILGIVNPPSFWPFFR